MLRVCRTDYFIRVLVVTAMVWGFALPIAHLVCGMAIDSEAMLCDDHAPTDGADESAGQHASGHAATLSNDHNGHAAPAREANHGHAAPADAVYGGHHAHAGVLTVPDDAARDSRGIPCPPVEFAAGDMSLECCWVDANAADRRAPLPSVTQLQDVAIAKTGVAPTVAVGEAHAREGATDSGSAPPIAFRFLFSVFLI